MIGKIRYLCLEIAKDAEMKIKKVGFFRDQYHKSLTFQVGEMVFHMRDKFSEMVYIFQRTDQNLTYSHINHTENIESLSKIIMKAEEISQVARMMQEYEYRSEKKSDYHKRMTSVQRYRRFGGEVQRVRITPPAPYRTHMTWPTREAWRRGPGLRRPPPPPRPSTAQPTASPPIERTLPPRDIGLARAVRPTRRNQKWRPKV